MTPSQNTQEVDPLIQKVIRTLTIIGYLTGTMMTSYALFFQKGDVQMHGIKDMMLVYTEPLNKYFLENIKYRNYMLIICSAEIDVMTLVSFYRFSRYSTTWRFMIALAFFYLIRGIMTHIFTVESPAGYNYAYPGVFSLFVAYGKTPDFSFSGQIGLCMI